MTPTSETDTVAPRRPFFIVRYDEGQNAHPKPQEADQRPNRNFRPRRGLWQQLAHSSTEQLTIEAATLTRRNPLNGVGSWRRPKHDATECSFEILTEPHKIRTAGVRIRVSSRSNT